MIRRHAILAAITAPIVAAVGCGYPAFMFGPGGGGGGAGSTSSVVTSTTTGGGASASSTSASTSTSTSASTSGGPSSSSSSAGTGGSTPGCGIGHLVISEVRTHGMGGLTDEFVELYNGTDQAVMLDGFWNLEARAIDSTVKTYGIRWKGNGAMIAAYGHYLLTSSSTHYMGPAGDDTYGTGITDAASLLLVHDGITVDALCFFQEDQPDSADTFLDPVNKFTCEGQPVSNPHDGTDGTDTNVSLERKPGGAAGNCTDSDHNDDDFITQPSPSPEGTSAPPAP